MKSILICCVNYRTYDVLYEYLKSIDNATKQVCEGCKVEVCIADNTTTEFQDIRYDFPTFQLKVFPYHKNYGYMGGAVQMIKDLGESHVISFDFVIVSNVDIELDELFFKDLLSYDYKDVGWIVPSVYRTRNNYSNENPFQTSKPTRSKLDAVISLYKYPFIYGLYEAFSKFKNSKQSQGVMVKEESPYPIYAGMGSIFVFTQQMVEKTYPMEFPCFMYGEEIYYGYLVAKYGLKTVFYPTIKVYDIGSVSTSKLGNSRKCRMNYESLKKLREIIYKD